MDPYLERHWLDVHTKLVTYAADELNRRLPPDLIASSEERVAVESEGGGERQVGPDVRVFEPPALTTTAVELPAGAAVAMPYRLLAQDEPVVERFIKVIEAGTERLVTVIEFVSPTNKQGPGPQAFRSKRAELLESGVNFVEIDLVRRGDWRALLRPHVCGPKMATAYPVMARLPGDPAAVYLHPIALADRLPPVSVPLRPGDPAARVDLQELLNQVYVNGRYDRRINYTAPPELPLDEGDAAWADVLLRAAGKRR